MIRFQSQIYFKLTPIGEDAVVTSGRDAGEDAVVTSGEDDGAVRGNNA